MLKNYFMEKLRDSTLLFLVKKDATGKITEICLAMKKRGFGAGRWNGVQGQRVNIKRRLLQQENCGDVYSLLTIRINRCRAY
jgi:hypothetical protein